MNTRIRNLREDNDLTQKQISKFLNVSQVAYSYYEINKKEIPLELLNKLADFYGTSTDYILYRTDESSPYPKSNFNYILSIKYIVVYMNDLFWVFLFGNGTPRSASPTIISMQCRGRSLRRPFIQ